MNQALDADLLVIGAGPAGCSAALMAASLGLTCVLVEAEQVGGKLGSVGAIENVPGGWATGTDLAAALGADVTRLEKAGRCHLLTASAKRVTGEAERAEVELADGRTFAAQAVIVATGVRSLEHTDTGWVDAPSGARFDPLWRVTASQLEGRSTVVLGADRPLGTWLRTHPEFGGQFHVLHSGADSYKTDEVQEDRRAICEQVTHVEVKASGDRYGVTAQGAKSLDLTADVVLLNLGNKPAAIDGLVLGRDGYCPPGSQHPRVLTAGDIRSARFQRIAVAQGSGAESVLTRYYEAVGRP